jgi:polyisoprenyl-phosphate glycosyltransferase
LVDPFVSVIAPCFNEAECLPEFIRRVTDVCTSLLESDWELVLVDDGSRDDTWGLVSAASRSDPRVVGLRLSRNFGHQAALTAGLMKARGERILMIDADLQDPPELLGEMMDAMDRGVDVVYGRRTRRAGETWFKSASAALFYRLIHRLSDVKIPVDTGDFRLITRPVLEALLGLPERHRFVRGMIAWLGYRQEPVCYERDARFAGATNYTLSRMLKFAGDALTGFSTVPLRFAHVVANASLLFGLGVLGYVVWSYARGLTVPGWASAVCVVALLSTAQLFVLGVIGEYVGRTYTEAKGRPLFIVAERTDEQQRARRRGPRRVA